MTRPRFTENLSTIIPVRGRHSLLHPSFGVGAGRRLFRALLAFAPSALVRTGDCHPALLVSASSTRVQADTGPSDRSLHSLYPSFGAGAPRCPFPCNPLHRLLPPLLYSPHSLHSLLRACCCLLLQDLVDNCADSGGHDLWDTTSRWRRIVEDMIYGIQ